MSSCLDVMPGTVVPSCSYHGSWPKDKTDMFKLAEQMSKNEFCIMSLNHGFKLMLDKGMLLLMEGKFSLFSNCFQLAFLLFEA
jgi:hypothetical protein